MTFSVYLVLCIAAIIVILVIISLTFRKKTHYTDLYNEGVVNENQSRYTLALQNYEDALSEMRKQNVDDKFASKVTQRIKILTATMEYEKNFQRG